MSTGHEFGGDWTEDKLAVMRRYFGAYSQALKNQRFAKWYVDAFAGTGDRTDTRAAVRAESLFGDDFEDVAKVKQGSVRIALGIDPPFDRYVLVERARDHVAALEALKLEFPGRNIDVRTGDANAVLGELCRTTVWRSTRAAVFIDPYGMQVNWSTLVSLAGTKAVDLALLFPTGPLNRMLTNDGEMPPEWAKRIDDHLGPCDWRHATYQTTEQTDLFASATPRMAKSITVEGLRTFVLARLQSIFPFVCEEQLELRNSRNAVLYHLFIICANPTEAAGKLAMKLARSAVKLPGGRQS